MKKHRYSIPIGLVVLLLIARTGVAQDVPIGKIEMATGSVTISHKDGRKIPAKEGMPLFAGDQLITGKDAEVRFSFDQGDRFALVGESEAAVDDLREAEGEPVLRLIAGYLRSAINSIGGKQTSVHTPTGVIGIRGTEFETAVSSDSATLIAVNKGSVEMDADGEKTAVNQGMMLESDTDGKKLSPLSKDTRWRDWQEQRQRKLVSRLPGIAPKLRRRFEFAADRLNRVGSEIRESLSQCESDIGTLKENRDRGKRKTEIRLRARVMLLRKVIPRFRQRSNRVMLLGRFAERLETFVRDNKERFAPADLEAIGTHLKEIAKKNEQLKVSSEETISQIRQTFAALKEFRQEMSDK